MTFTTTPPPSGGTTRLASPVADLTPTERQAALAELERIADTLGQISTWLSGLGQNQAVTALECSWRDVAAACWVLEHPVGTQPDGWLGST